MKRYNIYIDAEAVTTPNRTMVKPNTNGRWVRYEDVAKFVELVEHANDPECYCDELEEGEDPEVCLACQYQEAIAEFRS